ncbi:glutamate racemase [Candidatus Shapirobacteria bacterium CG_4_9_14_0_2_um_filter_39_11]|uniref:Glutamate racemase n=1 Tax=Candidatus Shapirobacteria bacterium CG_4_9_14_0_2_um_filter_39_11 TaxID=1974478 RepID=A0A2M8ET26_9BACT|nr:MAG: glutamate racemase [Candidatus Shapirobacteria bacterium CG_4_9_14_0_2_um_filter_39_11]
MDQKNKPIGVFDSGLGGLTVVKEIIKLLPFENIVYLGDTARVPYGTRSNEIIKKFSEENVNFLLEKKVKCIVIACHTSSAVAGNYLKKKFSKIPIFNVVTPVLESLCGSKKKIGVIGTRATVNSGVYSKLNKVTEIPCPLFVPFIEEGEIKGMLIKSLVTKYIGKLKVEILVLGCTHYPIIKDVIKNVLPNTELINPGIIVAAMLKNYLVKNNLTNNQKRGGKRNFYVTDLNKRFVKVAEMFLGQKLEIKCVRN